jgi:spermidine synthase
MKPRIKIAESTTNEGAVMGLYAHDGNYSISLNGQELMHSRATTSERMLGEIGIARLKPGKRSRILIGGLGLGFTLKSVLASIGQDSQVDVIELLPDITIWNQTFLKELNGSLLEDPRVRVIDGDVTRLIQETESCHYDSVLLDIDNGPIAMVSKHNASLYSNQGIRATRDCLANDGRAVIWSASPDPQFENRLLRAKFKVSSVPAKMHDGAKRAAYLLYVADK